LLYKNFKKMKSKLFAALTLLFFSLFAVGQNVSGTLKDGKGSGIGKKSIALLKAADSSIVKIEVTEKDGSFVFENIKAGNFLLSFNEKGFEKKYFNAFTLAEGENKALGQLLVNVISNPQDIVVTARKPLIEVRADKMILNVENSINSVGSDALELLRKSPGVIVDKDDNLSLSGKNGVRIYIDGKPSPLSGTDLAAFLKNLQSSQIETIEIIKNPSAKYDAAGNAGIINIKLKKNKTIGTNGSINAGVMQGIYPKYMGGLNLNHRTKAANWFGNVNVNKSKNENNFNLYRSLLDTIFDQKNVMTNRSQNIGYKVGADFYANKKSTYGFVINGDVSSDDMDSDSRTPITYKPTGISNKTLLANNLSSTDNNNINFNGNYRYSDTSGRDFSLDLDYGNYNLLTNQLLPNIYINPITSAVLSKIVYNMIPDSKINLGSIKADYEQNYKGGKLGVGIKSSLVKTTNDFKRYDVFTSSSKLDTLRSNDFAYNEVINAGYINYNKQLKNGWMYQIGLRAEHTNIKGTSTGYKYRGTYIPYDSTFKRNYLNLFPSAAITYNKNPMSQWTMSYSRRIDRPAYQDLNPFEFKLDEYTFQKGNTNLRPQYTNSVSISNTYKYMTTTSLEYSHVTDVFTQLVDTIDASKSFISKQNLATQNSLNFNIGRPIMKGKFNGYVNFSTNYSKYKADFGTGRKIEVDAVQVNLFADNSYKINKTTTAQLSGWVAGPGIWQGTFKSKAMGGFDIGMGKSLFNNKANLKVTLTDVLRTMRWSGTSNFAGQVLTASGNWESRQLRLNFTYRFGSNQIKAAKERKSSSETEKNRIKSGGGGLGG
jgi:iron complex outermembrane recepter protein